MYNIDLMNIPVKEILPFVPLALDSVEWHRGREYYMTITLTFKGERISLYSEPYTIPFGCCKETKESKVGG